MIEPAMTPDEWHEELFDWEGNRQEKYPLRPDRKEEIYDFPHAIAALALYNQPFGFTREMVRALDWRIEQAAYPHEAEELRAIRDRIEALLPPESK